MIFSELYSVYYNTVAKIISSAVAGELNEKELISIVNQNAFSESVLTIVPALKNQKWQLLHSNLTTQIKNPPSMPLTTLQKRWLKALCDDPRLALFDVELPSFEDVEPLFTNADYKIYDKYGDGDPFNDDEYIRKFRLILGAIKEKKPIKITLVDRNGKELWVRFFPVGLEYSAKDDKFRVVATGCKFKRFNLAKIKSCEIYRGNGPWNITPREDKTVEVELIITDNRNALERAMLHFAHFEKQAKALGNGKYSLRIKYYKSDETEMVIRVLSFGPNVQVAEPQDFAELIKERLVLQMECGLR